MSASLQVGDNPFSSARSISFSVVETDGHAQTPVSETCILRSWMQCFRAEEPRIVDKRCPKLRKLLFVVAVACLPQSLAWPLKSLARSWVRDHPYYHTLPDETENAIIGATGERP